MVLPKFPWSEPHCPKISHTEQGSCEPMIYKLQLYCLCHFETGVTKRDLRNQRDSYLQSGSLREQFLFSHFLSKAVARLPGSQSAHTEGLFYIPTGWRGALELGKGPKFSHTTETSLSGNSPPLRAIRSPTRVVISCSYHFGFYKGFRSSVFGG